MNKKRKSRLWIILAIISILMFIFTFLVGFELTNVQLTAIIYILFASIFAIWSKL